MEAKTQIELEKAYVDSMWVETASSETPSLSEDASNSVQFDSPEIRQLETRLLRKIDLNILPLMALSMFISFLVCHNMCHCRPCGSHSLTKDRIAATLATREY